MKKRLHLLPIRFSRKLGGELLREFANLELEPDCIDAFTERWSYGGWPWTGGSEVFRETQRLIREMWAGKHKNNEDQIVRAGLASPRGEYYPTIPVDVSWKESGLVLRTRDLNDVVWLAVLQNGKRLAMCQNPDCKTPYFVRFKRDQKYCSAVCAKPAQLEAKRVWWAEHGRIWREQHEMKSNQRRRK